VAAFVIVHGGWGGGWEWREVADTLIARGHRVATPTLTGQGERSHLLTRKIGLETHVEDVTQAIRWERMHDVLLVGHSYGGMVATAAASSMADQIRGLIYVDAFIPENGQSTTDLLDPAWVDAMVVSPATERGGGWLVPFPFEDDLARFPANVAERYRSSVQPLATFTDPAMVDARIRALPSAFIHCTGKAVGEDAFVGFAGIARERGWWFTELDSGHDVQIEHPGLIADELHRIALHPSFDSALGRSS
jgi:pimeloyl-ACP methyl ester carboxylesterase